MRPFRLNTFKLLLQYCSMMENTHNKTTKNRETDQPTKDHNNVPTYRQTAAFLGSSCCCFIDFIHPFTPKVHQPKTLAQTPAKRMCDKVNCEASKKRNIQPNSTARSVTVGGSEAVGS